MLSNESRKKEKQMYRIHIKLDGYVVKCIYLDLLFYLLTYVDNIVNEFNKFPHLVCRKETLGSKRTNTWEWGGGGANTAKPIFMHPDKMANNDASK